MPTHYRYIKLFKPYDVLTQFTDEAGRATLKDFVDVPGVYPIGRLDRDSEGLLLLTDDGRLAHCLADPRFEHPKTYWSQVERGALARGDRGASARRCSEGRPHPSRRGSRAARRSRSTGTPRADPVPQERANLLDRADPARGRNRQVRRMTAAVGHPTLRLVRVAIGRITLGDLVPGNGVTLTPTSGGRSDCDGRRHEPRVWGSATGTPARIAGGRVDCDKGKSLRLRFLKLRVRVESVGFRRARSRQRRESSIRRRPTEASRR